MSAVAPTFQGLLFTLRTKSRFLLPCFPGQALPTSPTSCHTWFTHSRHTGLLFFLRHRELISSLALCPCAYLGCSSPGCLHSLLPPGLYSKDTSSRRPSLTAPYTLKPIPTPIGLYPLHCFVFLQSTSQPLALHGPLPVVLSPARS